MSHKISKYEILDQDLDLTWENGETSRFDFLWLRDNCPSAFHPATRERNFDLLSVPEEIKPESVNIKDGNLEIDWQPIKHHSSYSLEWLKSFAYSDLNEAESEKTFHYQSWDKNYLNKIFSADFNQIINEDKALLEWMLQLYSKGLVLIKNMSQAENAMESVVKKIAHLRETNFGVIFEVVSKPNPNNQAYTAEGLPLHTDLPNQELSPGFQFLHCLKNEAEGGHSTFTDGFAVAEKMQAEYPEEFLLLADYRIPFRFHDANCDIVELKPVFSVKNGKINEVNFNAHIASTFRLPANVMRAYYLAYRRLMGLLNHSDFKISFKLNSNEMVAFDNRRILHGRTAFDPSTGFRRLRGCYVDRGDFKSRIRVLKKLGKN